MGFANWPCSVCGTPANGSGPTLCKMHRPLERQLDEAGQWCMGEQAHTPYSDADYVRLFQAAAEEIRNNAQG